MAVHLDGFEAEASVGVEVGVDDISGGLTLGPFKLKVDPPPSGRRRLLDHISRLVGCSLEFWFLSFRSQFIKIESLCFA